MPLSEGIPILSFEIFDKAPEKLLQVAFSLIIFSIYTKRFYEHFVSYKSHLVQLKKEVTNPLVIAVGNENEYISNFSKAF